MPQKNVREIVLASPELRELLHTANDLALEASRQAGVLAAAVIAGVNVWGPQPLPPSVKLAILSLIASVVFAALAHLATASDLFKTIGQLAHGKEVQPQTLWNLKAWIFGGLQLLLLLAALIIAAIALLK